jgi:hypothetical protein
MCFCDRPCNCEPQDMCDVPDFSLIIDGVNWTYDGDTVLGPWSQNSYAQSFPTSHMGALRASDVKRCLNVMEEWERWKESITPKRMVRLRVVQGTAKWVFRNGLYFQYAADPDDSIRDGTVGGFEFKFLTVLDMKAIDDIRKNGPFEESLDGGKTWSPSHKGPDAP